MPLTPPTSQGSGGFVLLETKVAAASATLDFAATISTAYEDYAFEILSLRPSTTSVLQLRFSTDGGASYDASAIYDTGQQAFSASGQAVGGLASQTAAGFYPLSGRTMVTTANYGLDGTLRLKAPGSALFKQALGTFLGPDSATILVQHLNVDLRYLSVTPVNAVRFTVSSGTITSGTIRSYGMIAG